jgi:hypothetical protein
MVQQESRYEPITFGGTVKYALLHRTDVKVVFKKYTGVSANVLYRMYENRDFPAQCQPADSTVHIKIVTSQHSASLQIAPYI